MIRLLSIIMLLFAVPALAAPDPLPSWNDSAAKKAVLAHVGRVTTPGPDFVPPPERVAVLDNDGTLWPENPMPFQAAFAFDEIKRRAPVEPELAADPIVKALLAGDTATLWPASIRKA